MLTTRTHGPKRRALWLVVAVALVLLQTLGAVHRVAHGVGPGSARAAVELAAADAAAATWLQKLFAGHDKATTCDAFDQGANADLALDLAAAVVDDARSSAVPGSLPSGQTAREILSALARGPPLPT